VNERACKWCCHRDGVLGRTAVELQVWYCLRGDDCRDRLKQQRDAWRHYALAWKNCASPEALHRAEGRVRTLCGEDALS